mgnify:CR=1 FL=1
MDKTLTQIIKALDDAKLLNISVYDLDGANPFYNYVIIASAQNKRQMQSSIRYIDEEKIEYDHIEGRNSEEWILIDIENYIVHIFNKESREQYDLDSLYINSKKIEVE